MVPTMKDVTPKKAAKRALAALDQTEPAVDTRIRQRPISKRVNTAIDHLVSGDVKTIKEAAEKGGMPRESLSRALSTPHIGAADLGSELVGHVAGHFGAGGTCPT